MSGKKHMTIGTVAAIGLVKILISSYSLNFDFNMIILLLGSIIGSYMPDIDSHRSTASQIFNKILTIFILIFSILYFIAIKYNLTFIHYLSDISNFDFSAIFSFCILTVLGKLSPHRMFTHKWFGTLAFCSSIYFIGNIFLTIGFTLGYLLHILGDRITKNGKHLNFFEFKLPLVNSKNKFTISW